MWTSGSGRSRRRAACAILAAASLLAILLVSQPGVWPADDGAPAGGSPTDEAAAQRIELFIALLKRRAQEALDAHRAPPPPLVTGSVDLAQGYESNVNLDGLKRGDFFTQETATVTLAPQLASWLSGELTYELLNTHYAELRDANLWMNTLRGALQLTPHRRVRAEASYEYSLVNFPFDTSNSFFDHRLGVEARTALAGWLTYKAGWSYQFREYDTRKARDGAGDDLPDSVRDDQRHTLEQELQARVRGTSARIGWQFYRNVSNDHFQDFYDWEDYQVRGVLSRVVNPEWIATLVSSYERRNYESRSVPNLNVAERDTLMTVAGSLIYLVTEHAQVAYSLTYRYQDSNDPRLDFLDWINQVRVSLTF